MRLSLGFDKWFQDRFYQNNLRIDLSLDRVMEAKGRLHPLSVPIILVGGTNGKGSTCSYLENVYHRAGYRVGSFTSPHIVTVRERIRYNCSVFSEEVWYEIAEKFFLQFSDLELTFFEAITVISFIFWQEYSTDVLIYEVGLGGRLDATNVLDAECSIVTSIDLDHQHYLGNDRESVGLEKAGIFRKNKVAVCGDLRPPSSLLLYAREIGSNLCCLQKDFYVYWEQVDNKQWCHSSSYGLWKALPVPSMRGRHQLRNASCALMAVQALFDRLPVSLNDIRFALTHAVIPGRFQVIPGQPSIVLDVAHNPASVNCLVDTLTDMPYSRNVSAVFSCLADKDIQGIIELIKVQIDRWFICELPSLRACSVADISKSLCAIGVDISKINVFSEPLDAYREAYRSSLECDRIVVFGSFYLIGYFMKIPSFSWHRL
ncbi:MULTISPECIES: bifunctional folylpolyglutamate synthase/dihydrofolate synthase [Candidatus Ichthyocystis]|uniref:bifunctional folylpolyglutamate synthase/dihydrofolate synthase n=1 Tax=Candidatus Ichthyocystis TaxID=2929841 RepID=UPI000B33C9BD|nr:MULTISPECIES: folylpolyglutamate synthase/dihydrofolate synthase family protein [Ichthyocystis]